MRVDPAPNPFSLAFRRYLLFCQIRRAFSHCLHQNIGLLPTCKLATTDFFFFCSSSEHRHASHRRLCPASWRSVVVYNSDYSRDCSTVYKTKFNDYNKTHKKKNNWISFLSCALRNVRYWNEYNTLNTIHSVIFYNMFRPFMSAINRYNYNINWKVYWGRVCLNIIPRWHRTVCIAYN